MDDTEASTPFPLAGSGVSAAVQLRPMQVSTDKKKNAAAKAKFTASVPGMKMYLNLESKSQTLKGMQITSGSWSGRTNIYLSGKKNGYGLEEASFNLGKSSLQGSADSYSESTQRHNQFRLVFNK